MNIEEIARTTIMEYLSGLTEEYKENEIKVGTYKNIRMTMELLNEDGEYIIRKYRKNDKLLEEVHYKNFKRDGIGKRYHENGVLHRLSKYKNDKLEHLEEYRADNTLRKKSEYRNGRRHGKTEKFDSFGKKCKSINEYKGGNIKKEIIISDNGRIETTYGGYNNTETTRQQFVNDILIAKRTAYPYYITEYYDISGNLIATKNGYNIRMSDMYKI
jgi:antitoxin component YwqK of YwqJK toxin-antitoxin module